MSTLKFLARMPGKGWKEELVEDRVGALLHSAIAGAMAKALSKPEDFEDLETILDAYSNGVSEVRATSHIAEGADMWLVKVEMDVPTDVERRIVEIWREWRPRRIKGNEDPSLSASLELNDRINMDILSAAASSSPVGKAYDESGILNEEAENGLTPPSRKKL